MRNYTSVNLKTKRKPQVYIVVPPVKPVHRCFCLLTALWGPWSSASTERKADVCTHPKGTSFCLHRDTDPEQQAGTDGTRLNSYAAAWPQESTLIERKQFSTPLHHSSATAL